MSIEREMRRAWMRKRHPRRRPPAANPLLRDGWERIRDGVEYDQYRIDERGAFGRMQPPATTEGSVNREQ